MHSLNQDSAGTLAAALHKQSEQDAAVTSMDAVMQDIHHMYEVLEHQCTGCGDCFPYCPVPGALEKYEFAF